MIVAISGGTGFIGQKLTARLRALSSSVRFIDRASLALPDEEFLKEKIEGAGVVINLAGASISKKWTREYKEEILASRVVTTRKIAAAINRAVVKPQLFISGSATGIYPSTGIHTEETGTLADNFLGKVCMEWEREARAAENSTRLVILRIGVVLGDDGGMLEKIAAPFRYGLGGKLGSGRQAFSFIHIRDLVNAVVFIIENEHMKGIINAVSPYPTDNGEFTRTLARVFGQPAFLTVPSFALKWMMGEGAEIALEGQKVIPEKLNQAGFRFEYPTIQNALVNIFS